MGDGSRKLDSVGSDSTARLTDDTLADIISRVPYKSTCCCKCVSTRWRDLISHPDHCKKMPQSLIGFFHESFERDPSSKSNRCFTNVSGKGDPLVDPSLSFLPKFEGFGIMDCCNGLLLCYFCKQNDPKKWDYVVCNPATEKWVVVPGTEWSSDLDARLAFYPAVSSNFYVCEFVENQFWSNEDYMDSKEDIAALVIYSSKTGIWSYNDDAWSGSEIMIPAYSESVLFRGVLYLCAFDYKLVALDVEENNWKVIPLPTPEFYGDQTYDIFLSQGQLYFSRKDGSELSIWVLEDPSSENWTLKHTVTQLQMFRTGDVSPLQMFGTEYSAYAAGFRVLSIHPDRSLIFLVCKYEEKLMSYDMDSRVLHFLCQVGRDGEIRWYKNQYLPYVPLYSELLADGH